MTRQLQVPVPLFLMGCGKMGSALLQGWVKQGINPNDLYVIEPNQQGLGALAELGVHLFSNVAQIAVDPAIVVIAVKPQVLDEILPSYRRFQNALFLSIAAGKERRYFKRHLGENARIVRAMPNTPAAVGMGMSVIHRATDHSAEELEWCQQLLHCVGNVAWIDDEAMMHAVTALSGGGPAYVFLLIETLEKAGIKVGLPPDLAAQLARKTVEGSAALSRLSEQRPTQLREAVTSPKGTTLEALNILMRSPDGIQSLFDEAIAAASRRSQELAQG